MRAMAVVVVLFLAGCASQKTLQATGGSRADGVIELAFEYGMFEKPEVDWAHGQSVALQRCQAWGYNGAEPFGGGTTQCQAYNGYGSCVRTLVTFKYQCLGDN